MIKDYIKSAEKQFAYYKMLAEKTFTQLNDDQFFFQYNNASNSIATIIKHLSGNMLSRWTNFLTTDGEKEWRNRDKEFEIDKTDKATLLQQWEAGWQCLFDALNTVDEHNFETIIYIRNQGHSITDAINRQLAHYAYHIGQIVFIGKMLLDASFINLSIPKGASLSYNTEKFSTPKKTIHFTDEYLNQPGKEKS